MIMVAMVVLVMALLTEKSFATTAKTNLRQAMVEKVKSDIPHFGGVANEKIETNGCYCGAPAVFCCKMGNPHCCDL